MVFGYLQRLRRAGEREVNMKRARDFRAIARQALKGHWGVAVGVSLVACILGVGTGGGSTSGASSYSERYDVHIGYRMHELIDLYLPFLAAMAAFAAVVGIAFFIIGSAAELGIDLFFIRLVRGEQVRFSALFERFGIILKAVGLRLFRLLFIVLWSLLFLIPGIIAAFRYSMAGFIMADNPDTGITEAVNISKEMMRGNKGRLFCLVLSFIGWGFLCLFTFGIGYLWLIPYVQASVAAFYLDISGRGRQAVLKTEMI
jgi:uncharacterized membrane protein